MATRMEKCPACKGSRVVPNAKTGSPETCPICAGSGKVEPAYLRLPFWYIILQVLTASQVLNSTLNIEPRADFEWVWLAATSTGIFRTELFDASGRAYQSEGVDNANQWGTAQNPFPLVVPVVLSMRSAINYRLTERSVAGNTVQLALIGYELYPENAA